MNSALLVTLLAAALLAAPAARAEFYNDAAFKLHSVALLGSVDSNTIRDFDADKFELDARFSLPWSWRSASGWTLSSGLAAGLGADGASALAASVGPTLTLRWARWALIIDGGVSPTFISRDQFNDFDLGGQFHFTSHIGVSYGFATAQSQSTSFSIGYRFQHISNAGLDSFNPGLDFHLLELRYWLD